MSNLMSFNFALGIHYYTHSVVFVIVCLIITGFLVYLNKKWVAIIFFSSFVFTAGSVVVLKYLLAVPRPSGALIDAGSYAFPSSHAALSMFLVTTITWIMISHSNISQKLIWVISTLLFLSSMLIGLSRLTLHVHTPIQVIAGFVLGFIIPVSVIYLFNRYQKTNLSSVQ